MGTVVLVTHGTEKRWDERKAAEAERQKNEVKRVEQEQLPSTSTSSECSYK